MTTLSIAVLDGVRVLEFDAIGPVPFCAMLLANHGAEVTRITRPGGQPNGIDAGEHDLLLQPRSRQIALDLKTPEGIERALALAAEADVLLEGYRPGVMERLGLGPEACHVRNPKLVYGRVTGYGQTGPLAQRPGHDINYIALTGALNAIGDRDRPPPPPLSLVGDFGGGGMLAGFGIVAALLRAERSGKGCVMDAAMVDGSASLMAMNLGWFNAGLWSAERESNILDGAAPYYRCYRTADGRFLAVGAIEPKFYAAMRQALGLDDPLFDDQNDTARWPAMRDAIAKIIAQRTLAEWQPAIDAGDACISPVLGLDEVASHPHNASRQTVTERDGRLRVGRAPRFYDSNEQT